VRTSGAPGMTPGKSVSPRPSLEVRFRPRGGALQRVPHSQGRVCQGRTGVQGPGIVWAFAAQRDEWQGMHITRKYTLNACTCVSVSVSVCDCASVCLCVWVRGVCAPLRWCPQMAAVAGRAEWGHGGGGGAGGEPFLPQRKAKRSSSPGGTPMTPFPSPSARIGGSVGGTGGAAAASGSPQSSAGGRTSHGASEQSSWDPCLTSCSSLSPLPSFSVHVLQAPPVSPPPHPILPPRALYPSAQLCWLLQYIGVSGTCVYALWKLPRTVLQSGGSVLKGTKRAAVLGMC